MQSVKEKEDVFDYHKLASELNKLTKTVSPVVLKCKTKEEAYYLMQALEWIGYLWEGSFNSVTAPKEIWPVFPETSLYRLTNNELGQFVACSLESNPREFKGLPLIMMSQLIEEN